MCVETGHWVRSSPKIGRLSGQSRGRSRYLQKLGFGGFQSGTDTDNGDPDHYVEGRGRSRARRFYASGLVQIAHLRSVEKDRGHSASMRCCRGGACRAWWLCPIAFGAFPIREFYCLISKSAERGLRSPTLL
jgi:hypothetical protein